MGLPFLPVRSFGGTDGFTYSGAKLVEDPFTGKPITIVPALNPDVAIIHVQQADEYGNARVFGTGIAHEESAHGVEEGDHLRRGDHRHRRDPPRSGPHVASRTTSSMRSCTRRSARGRATAAATTAPTRPA